MKRANRRDAIIAATGDLARSKGLSHVTTRAIAEAVGCSEGAIYVHFPGRAELLLAVLEERLPGMVGALSELDQQVGRSTPERNLKRALDALFQYQEQVLPVMAALFAEPELLAAYRNKFLESKKGPARGIARLQRYLRAEQELGRVDAAVDCEMAARGLLAGCFFHAFTKLFFDSPEPFRKLTPRMIAAHLRL
ncbi:MAG: TetR/AcrR family transcriptional regulator [Bryobacteraceae bacterium]